MTKVIAAYLPQYHVIPENSKWWGEGYTDWVGVKAALPQYDGHLQPNIPLNGYYDLSDWKVMKEQAELAKKYGVYGFGIYHYWFSSNQQLLTKPAENLLEHKEIDISFMFIWDNSSWIRTWSNIKNSNQWAPTMDNCKEDDNPMLAPVIYGDEKDWKKHFSYLLQFFKDPRYIKLGNKPLFTIFNPFNEIETLNKMIDYWNGLAIEEGFDGIIAISAANRQNVGFEYTYRYEPFSSCSIRESIDRKVRKIISQTLKKPMFYDYDKLWRRILKNATNTKKTKYFLGAFVNFDDTPRRGKKARIIKGGTPEKFQFYFTQLLKICLKRKDEFVFLTAWNEWGEGAYLEPDIRNGYGYLEALKKAIESVS
ncbi:glycosyltransferase WbsX family protein [Agathobacter sp.]